MSLYVNTNLGAMTALNNLTAADASVSTAMQRLASGLQINSAADDAAGYVIVQGMTSQLNGVTQAEQNTQDGVSLVQTAEGALSSVAQMLQRIRELAVQYGNGTASSVDQLAITSEVDQLASEIERVGDTAQFNGIYLLDSVSTISFQVGANAGEMISVATISLGAIASVSGAFGSSGANISEIDTAINAVAAAASTFGAVQNRLSYTLGNSSSYAQNLSAATTPMEDVNVASEMTSLESDQIIQQAGLAILAQANHQQNSIVTLLST